MSRADWPARPAPRCDRLARAQPASPPAPAAPAAMPRRRASSSLLFFSLLLGIPGGRSLRSDLSPPSLRDSMPYHNDMQTISPRSDAFHDSQQSQPYKELETILQQQKNPFNLPLERVQSELYSKELEANLEQRSLASEIEESDEPYDIDFESILQEKTPLLPLEKNENEIFNNDLESVLPESNSPKTDLVQDKSEPYGNDLESFIADTNSSISTDTVQVVEDTSEPYVKELGSKVDVSRPTSTTVETEQETNVQRDKRSSGQDWDKNTKSSGSRGRVQTGDTILNIRGAVRDAIGDAGAAPGPRASSRLDTFVIRGAARARPAPHAHHPPPADQVPRHARELLVSAHARARIPCDLDNATDVVWYKDNEPLSLSRSPAGSAVWLEEGAAVVGRATRADAGAWRCTAGQRSGQPVHLLIYEAVRSVYLAVDGRRLDAGNTWVPVRDKTELEVKCVAEGGVPPPALSWRLLALEPALDHRPYLRVHHTNYSLEGVSTSNAVVTAARELHNASLQCEARQRLPAPLPAPLPAASTAAPPARTHDVLAAKLEIHVTYPPSFVISRWPGFGVSLAAGGAAALRCDVDANPPARAWWLRDDDSPTSSPPPLESGGGGESRGSATLRWGALSTQHAGWYRCRASWLDADYSSIGYYLNVISAEEQTEPATEASTAEEEELEPEHQKVDVPVGGNVQLHCPKGSVGCWWRRVVGNSSESWAPAGSHHAHGVLGIKDAVYEEGGEYRCVGARGGRDGARLRELKRVTVRVSGGATAAALSAQPAGGGWRLECGACGRGVRVVWLRARRPPEHAALVPDLAQHCWRAVLHVHDPDEVWCVAATAGGGAVAVFPARAPHPSPAPARHTVRAPYNHAGTSPALLPYVMVCAGLLAVV